MPVAMTMPPQMPPKMPPNFEIIGDSTDPAGTLRPNLPPEPTFGTQFDPIPCPEFDYKINLPVDQSSPIYIFDLFFSLTQMKILMENTNKGGSLSRNTTIPELYTYLGILIYMGLHPENDIKLYWSTSHKCPTHTAVRTAMSRDRWLQISRAFHISGNSKTVFQKVSYLSYNLTYLPTNKGNR